jgi:hypothetical protein
MLTMSGLGRLAGLCSGLIALVVVTAPGVALGQVAKHPSEITGQLRTCTQLIQRALENMGDGQQAQAHVFQAYVQIRDVQAKMQNANGVAGFPYQLYAMALPQVRHARTRILEALNALQHPTDKGSAPAASAALSEALQVTETLLLTMF